MSKVFVALVAALVILVQGGVAADAHAAKKRSRQATQFAGVIKRVDRGAKVLVVTVRTGRRARRDVRVSVVAARISAPDRNRDGKVGVADLSRGQRVTVVAKGARKSRRTLRATRVVAKAATPQQQASGDSSGTQSGGTQGSPADPGEREEDAEEPEVDPDSLLDALGEALRRGETPTVDATGAAEEIADATDPNGDDEGAEEEEGDDTA